MDKITVTEGGRTVIWSYRTGVSRRPRWWEYWAWPWWQLRRTGRWLMAASGFGPERLYTMPYVVPVIRDNRPVWQLRCDMCWLWLLRRMVVMATCDTAEQAMELARHRCDNPDWHGYRGDDGKLKFRATALAYVGLEVIKVPPKEDKGVREGDLTQ